MIIRRLKLSELGQIKGYDWTGFMGNVRLRDCVNQFKKRKGRDPKEIVASRNNSGRLIYIR